MYLVDCTVEKKQLNNLELVSKMLNIVLHYKESTCWSSMLRIRNGSVKAFSLLTKLSVI